MSEPMFTKGLWNLDALSVIDSEKHAIACCQYNWLLSDDDDEVMANAIANASLIAAAPEMYAMLEDMLARFAEESVEYGMIQKLLAKARGEK